MKKLVVRCLVWMIKKITKSSNLENVTKQKDKELIENYAQSYQELFCEYQPHTKNEIDDLQKRIFSIIDKEFRDELNEQTIEQFNKYIELREKYKVMDDNIDEYIEKKNKPDCIIDEDKE